MSANRLDVRPLTPGNWHDLEAVLGANGGARGCWCMHWRLSISEWMENKGDGNREALRELASKEPAPGLIAYRDGEPMGWCLLGPRSAFPRLERSTHLAPIDNEPVCAIVCLFIHRKHRRAGLLTELLDAASGFAASNGYNVVEGYPVDPPAGKKAGSDTVMTGIASVFLSAGFTEVARPKADRPIMRRFVS